MLTIQKIINTFFYPRFLYQKLIKDSDYVNLKKKKSLLEKVFYFYPTIVDASSWSEGDVDAYRDPLNFIKLRPGLDSYFLEYFSDNIPVKARILDLGCNSGRHLNALCKLGFLNLNGVDVMETAFREFKKYFPDTFDKVVLKKDFFQRFLLNNSTQFDVIYTIGATIELVHPSFDIVKLLTRNAKTDILLLIQPNAHNYPRFYKHEFYRHGFKVFFEKKLSNTHVFYHFKSLDDCK